MRPLPYLVALGIVLVVLIASAGHASAQNQPKQYGGGYVTGVVYGYDMWDELITIGWADITASSDVYSFKYSSYGDGTYGFYLPTGTFNLTVDEQGFVPQSRTLAVSDGSSTGGFNFFLQRSNVPIPEYPTQLFAVLMIIAISAGLLATRAMRRKTR
jgi:hypothetical protein